MSHNFAAATPEIFLAVAAMALLMLGVFRGNAATRLVAWLTSLAMLIGLFLVVQSGGGTTITFADMFVVDGFARFAKLLILLSSAIAVIMSLDFIRTENMERFEYPVLMLLASLGMCMMVSANDLISLYLGVELQSLALYVVAAFQRNSLRSSEAGLKYFVLGALSSGMLLYGCSLIYGFTGATGFGPIAKALTGPAQGEIGLIFGLVFLTAGLAFKVSAVPFHMWTPDVYEGAPTPVTAFFAVAPKVAALCLFARVMLSPFGGIVTDWQPILVLIAALSVILGAFAAIAQHNIKRLMAYSSIGHVGFALIGLAAGTEEGLRGVLVYLAIYLAMNIGTFACILTMRRGGKMVEEISDLSGLAKNNPMMAGILMVLMFSLAGIPPLAGFFGKLYIFVAAINAHLYWLSVIAVLASVVGAFYYLRIVKVMYFDDAADPFDSGVSLELKAVMGISALIIVLFVFAPGLILEPAASAAQALVH